MEATELNFCIKFEDSNQQYFSLNIIVPVPDKKRPSIPWGDWLS